MKLSGWVLGDGQALLVVPAAGGGYGDPLERNPELVREDVWNEKLTRGAAEATYGVVVSADALAVDEAATREARLRIGQERGRDSGPARVSGLSPWPATTAELEQLVAARSQA
jgi:N-methylhydantoinase B